MRRRTFVTATLGGALLPGIALAQEQDAAPPASGVTVASQPPLIEPQNALEYAFVAALTNSDMRPVFRRYLIDTHVALALSAEDADSAPLEVDVRQGFRAAAVFTSAARADAVLGGDAPRVILNGRAALERARGKNVVINFRLRPMLTLEPEDVETYLAAPGASSAGPSQ